MADEIKKVAILDILVKSDDAEKRLGELKVSQQALIAQNKELQKDYAKNSELIATNGLRIKELAREEAALTKITQNQTVANKAQEGSNDQLKAKIALLTTQYNKLGKEERDNTKAGKDLQKQIKSLTDELKKNEGAVGDNRRNVGGYKDDILKAADASGFFNTEVGQMIQNVGVGLNQALIVSKASFGSWSGFLKANVVGAIALVAGSLISFYKNTGAGADQFDQQIARLKGAGSGIAQNLAQAGKQLTQGNFKNAFNEVFGDKARENVAKTAKAFKEMEEITQHLGDQERDYKLAAEQSRNEIDRLILSSKDLSKTELQRIKDLQLAGEKEKKLLADEKSFLEVRKALAIRRRNLSQDPTGDLKDAVTEQEVAIAQLQGKSAQVQQTIVNRNSALLQEIKAKSLKILQDQINEANATLSAGLDKDRAELIRKLAQNAITYYDYERELSKITLDGLKLRKQDADKAIQDSTDTDDKLSSLGINAAKETLDIAVKAEQDKIQLAKQTAEELLAIKNKAIQDEINLENAKYQALTNIGNSLVELNRAIAGNNADSTEFGKVLAGIQIAIAEAQSISETIRNATAAAAAGGPSAPFLQAAYIAEGIATVVAAFVQTRALFDNAEVPRPEFYDGFGYTGDGPARQESTALGPKPYTYHKKELIASDAALSTTEGAMAGNILMMIMKKQPRFKVPGYFNGGVFDGGMTNRVNSQPVYEEMAANNNLLRAIASLPRAEVLVSKINRGQKEYSSVNVSKDLH